MTYEQWWCEFVAEHEDWKYADSDALRKAAFKGGQESMRQQLAAALSAIKAKDDAIRIALEEGDLYASDNAKLELALAIQADDSALQAFAEKVQEQCAILAETPIYCEQDDITMEAKDRVAKAIRNLKELPK